MKKDDSNGIKDELKRNRPRKSTPPMFSISKVLAMTFILGLMFGPKLALGSPTQNYPGYRPNSNSIDFRKLNTRLVFLPNLNNYWTTKMTTKQSRQNFWELRHIHLM